MGVCMSKSYKISPIQVNNTNDNTNDNNSDISSITTLSYIDKNDEECIIRLASPTPKCVVRDNTIYINYKGQTISMPIQNNDNMDITAYKKICSYD